MPERPASALACSLAVLAASGVLACGAALAQRLPVPCAGGPCGTSPVPQPFVASGQATHAVNGATLTVNQASSRAILNWQSFNVAPGHGVVFDHQTGPGAATLNRIWQADPSVIRGAISAQGAVYLINQNGIVFGDGAQVNVGSLVASTLDVGDRAFQNGLLSVRPGDAVFAQPENGGFGDKLVRIDAGAEIRTPSGGRVLVFAPRVENAGSISTPDGQTILAAGGKVYLTAPLDPALRGFLVEVDPYRNADGSTTPGMTINEALGRIVAERGNVTLAGLAVRQDGQVRATTSVTLNGSVILQARDTVRDGTTLSQLPITETGDASVVIPRGRRTGALTLGPGSLTEVQPELASERTTLDEQPFTRSLIELAGRTIHLETDAAVLAPGGTVRATAQDERPAGRPPVFQEPGQPAAEGVRIYLERGARIDVAGTREVPVPMERNVVTAELRGAELRDAPLQRGGFLQGKEVRVDVRRGTPLADVSGFVSQIPRGVGERTAAGGTATLRSEGDLIVREGATIDFSGGSVRFLDGYVNTSKLVSEGRIYDISVASPDRIYSAFADTWVVEYAKWGVTETFRALLRGEFTPGYLDGRDAGGATLLAHRLVLDGTVRGDTTVGRFQRETGRRPRGGSLTIGDATGQIAGSNPAVFDYKTPALVIGAKRQPLPADFVFASGPLPAPWRTRAVLAAADLGGIDRLAIYSNDTVTLDPGVTITTGVGGAVSLTGRSVAVLGSIASPGGAITVASAAISGGPAAAADYAVAIGPGARLDARGTWVNDSQLLAPVPGADPIGIHGGSITLRSQADLLLAPGTVLDVGGGGWVQSTPPPLGGKPSVQTAARLRPGDGGSITLGTGRFGIGATERQTSVLRLDGELRGLAAGAPSKLALAASAIRIGEARGGDPRELKVAPEVLAAAGFGELALTGQDGVVVADRTELALSAARLAFEPSFVIQPTGADPRRFSAPELPPPETRTATHVRLAAPSPLFGDIRVGRGARIAVEPGGSIALAAGRRILVEGTLEAPAGAIGLTTPPLASNEPFDPTLAIWLSAGARLLAPGTTRIVGDDRGRLRGDVLAGGTVAIEAGNGPVVLARGSLIDVSGARGVLDLPQLVGGAPAVVRTEVASAAGSIVIGSGEGLFLDGELRGAAAASAAGGALALTFDRANRLPLGAPQTPRTLALRARGPALPANLGPGDSLAALNGSGHVNLDTVVAGGFHELALRSESRIELDGRLDATLERSLALDAPVIAARDGAAADLGAAYVLVGNTAVDRQGIAAVPSGGSGTLALRGRLVELAGATVLQGFETIRFASSGDIRLRGVRQGVAGSELAGALVSGGDLAFSAAQLYPTTQSSFHLAVRGRADGHISFAGGGSAAPPLSAGGALAVEAPVITQAGTLRAPFGRIALEAGDRLDLAPGSLTSVAAAGQLIPYGRTELGGRDYSYSLGDRSLPIETLPAREVRLVGPAVAIRPGATVDLAGGGDLLAHEFVPGPGGSRDLLDPAFAGGALAIVPALGAEFAPFDHQAQLGVSGLRPGDAVHLAGVPGLADGLYPLLPPRYALLPGAFLVRPVAGALDLLPGQTRPALDGSIVAAGYLATIGASGRLIRDARTSGFEVTPGALFDPAHPNRRAEYLLTTASGRFGSAGDAGRLLLGATDRLTLDGTVRSGAAAGGRGAEIDLAAPHLAIVSPGGAGYAAAFPGIRFVEVQSADLARLGAASLLLGGIRRSADAATVIEVGARNLVIANDASAILTAPELLAVAGETLLVQRGAALAGSGTAPARQGPLLIGGGGASGDGALVRVAAGGEARVARENVTRAAGTLAVESGASLTGGALTLDATAVTRSAGILTVAPGGALAVGASRISVGEVAGVIEGLVFSNAEMAALARVERLALRSYSTLDLYGSAIVGGPALRVLAVEAAGMGGYRNPAGVRAGVEAGTVTVANPGGVAFIAAPLLADGTPPPSGGGTLGVTAAEVMVGSGSFALAGFDGVELTATAALRGTGVGELTAGGDLTVTTGRIVAAAGASLGLRAGGALNTRQSGGGDAAAAAGGLGARIALEGARVEHATTIAAPSGTVSLRATGGTRGDGVTISGGGAILAPGTSRVFADAAVSTPGGAVSLTSARGDVVVADAATIDVAAALAGAVELAAPAGTAVVAGALRAGPDADLKVDVDSLASFSTLAQRVMAGGGFGREQSYRVRSGDVTIAPGDSLRAALIRVGVDAGSLDVFGTLDASGARGGAIELFAQRAGASGGHVTVHPGARLTAQGSGASSGGSIALGTATAAGASGVGLLNVAAGSRLDVSGGGGRVVLRAPRTGAGAGADLALAPVGADIAGAAYVDAEAVGVYEGVARLAATAGAGTLTFSTIAADNAAFLTNANAGRIAARLGFADTATTNYRVLAAVEVRSAGDLVVADDWNLQTVRAAGEPGVLTLRAAGSLRLQGSLSDGFSTATTAGTLQAGGSWSYRLTAGADAGAADPLATRPGVAGDVAVAAGRLVRTGAGTIDLAAAGALRLGDPVAAIYTAGVPAAPLPGFSNPNIGGVPSDFPTGGGDVRIAVGGDIVAPPATQLVTDWLYRQGALNANGTVRTATAWWPRFRDFRQGIGALGGGDVSVVAGGDIVNLGVAVPTSGRLAGAVNAPPDATRLDIQGGGDIRLRAGGDVSGAIYVVGRGRLDATAGGTFGTIGPLGTIVAIGDAQAALASVGDLRVEAVFNPTAAPQAAGNVTGAGGTARLSHFFTYGEASAFTATALLGDVTLGNSAASVGNAFPRPGNPPTAVYAIYPGTVRAVALSGNVVVGDRMTLFPAPAGTLELLAGGGVDGRGTISMSDVAPARLPGPAVPDTGLGDRVLPLLANASEFGRDFHSDPPLHAADRDPVRVVALGGDITGPVSPAGESAFAVLAKPGRFEAARDIRNVWVIGQNLREDDATVFAAGRDFVYDTLRDATGNVRPTNNSRIELGGPGELVLIAGRGIDLGNAFGVITRGNFNNPFLPETGAAIRLTVGAASGIDHAGFAAKYILGDGGPRSYAGELVAFVGAATGETLDVAAARARFPALPAALRERFVTEVLFTELRETGRDNAARGSRNPADYRRGYEAIAALFPGAAAGDLAGAACGPGGCADLNLFFSQVKTEQGGDISIAAPGGIVNAGLAAAGAIAKPPSQLGVVTVRGGDVRAVTSGDFQVNQSRVFTVGGGNILMWSSHGNIDAGKGAKTASATPPPRIVVRGDQIVLDTSQSIAGSGIGVLLGREGIAPGDVDLYAPKGVIDAGDAGIRSAGNFFATPVVVGAANISVQGAAVGVSLGAAPPPPPPPPTAAAAARSAEQAAAGATQDRAAEQAAQPAFRPTFITVEVIGFGE